MLKEELNAFGKGTNRIRPKSKSAVAYTRVSTKEQADNNQSLATQSKYIDAYVRQNGIQLVERFGGTYESAQNDERNEFQRMLEYVKKKKIDMILVYSFDRFSRSGANAVYLAHQLKQNNVELLSVTQPVDSFSAAGEFSQNIQFVFAQYDNEQRRQKCTAGIREMLNRGNWPTRPPVGYDIIRKNGVRLIEVNAKGRLIGRAFKKKLKENLSWNDLSLWLKSKGLSLSNKRLSEMSRNVFYCGYMAHKSLLGEVVKGNHHGIISKKDFLMLNQLLDSQYSERTKVNKKTVPELPLKGHLICSDCKTNMTGYQMKSKGIWYYKCNTKGCKHNVSANKLHNAWRKTLIDLQIEEKFIQPIKDQYKRTLGDLQTQEEKDFEALRTEFKAKQEKIEKVEERFAMGEIDNGIYKRVITKLQAELQQKFNDGWNQVQKISNLEETTEKALFTLCNLLTMWEKLNIFSKKRLVEALFPEGILLNKVEGIYRTQTINAFVDYIHSLSDDKTETKKRNKEVNFTYSALVAGSRIELPTSGL